MVEKLNIINLKTLSCAGVGFLARILALNYFGDTLKQRVEIVTPISSWKRAYEGVHLWNSGLDPYSGDLFHEYPISLQFYKFLLTYCDIGYTFAAIDTVTAILLQYSIYKHMTRSKGFSGKNDDADKRCYLAQRQSFKVLLTYLFSPITIMTCAGLSTSVFTNFLIGAILFILPLRPFRALTCVLCAFLACNNIYHTSLVLPIFLCLEYCNLKSTINQGKRSGQVVPYYMQPRFYSSLITSITIFLATLATLISTSYFMMGNSWTFLSSTYLFILKVQDLTPNIGMFWYFFIEMFEPFADFFSWIVHINLFIHIVPLSICLKEDPFFLLYVNLVTSTIFQPYSSLANIGMITSLLPQWIELYQHMKRGLIVTFAGLICMSLWPVFWHLWIVTGTANANFYFGFTLAFGVILVIFLSDILNSYGYMKSKLRHEHHKVE